MALPETSVTGTAVSTGAMNPAPGGPTKVNMTTTSNAGTTGTIRTGINPLEPVLSNEKAGLKTGFFLIRPIPTHNLPMPETS